MTTKLTPEQVDLCNGCDWWYDAEELTPTDDGLFCDDCLVGGEDRG